MPIIRASHAYIGTTGPFICLATKQPYRLLSQLITSVFFFQLGYTMDAMAYSNTACNDDLSVGCPISADDTGLVVCPYHPTSTTSLGRDVNSAIDIGLGVSCHHASEVDYTPGPYRSSHGHGYVTDSECSHWPELEECRINEVPQPRPPPTPPPHPRPGPGPPAPPDVPSPPHSPTH